MVQYLEYSSAHVFTSLEKINTFFTDFWVNERKLKSIAKYLPKNMNLLDDDSNGFVLPSNMSFEHSYGDHFGRPLRKIFASSGQYSELYLCLTIFAGFLVVTIILFAFFLSISYLTRKSCGIALNVETNYHKNRLELAVPPITLTWVIFMT